MICLTADVHQPMGTDEQRALPERELDAAVEYMDILTSYDISATLFLTGKCFDFDVVDALINQDDIEIGGHTWNALRPTLLHDAFGKIFQSKYGPSFYQKQDIRRTLRVIEENTGSRPRSWRTHSYASDQTTYQLLSDNGVKVISDYTTPDAMTPQRGIDGTWHLPVNAPPDHSHIIHGNVTPEEHERIGWEGTAFGTEMYDSSEWFQRVKLRIQEMDRSDVLTILAHPGCQKLIDDFETFDTLCSLLSEYRTVSVSQAIEQFR